MKSPDGPYEFVDKPNYQAAPEWAHWWAYDYKCCSNWWPEAPPSAHRILESMRREAEALQAYPSILEPEKMIKTPLVPALKRKTKDVMESGGTFDEALDSVREEVDKVYSRNRTNETFPDPPKREVKRGWALSAPCWKDVT